MFQYAQNYNPYSQYNQLNPLNQFNQFAQNPQNIHQMQELKYKEDLDIKFFRLHPAMPTSIPTPLSGSYHSLNAIEDNTQCSLQNKFSNFDIPPTFGIDNLLILNPSFGRIFVNEILEGLIIFHNKSDHIKQIKDLKVILTAGKKNTPLNLKLPKDTFIQKRSVYSIKFTSLIDSVGKYVIDIKVKSRSDFFDEQYKNNPQKYYIKKEGTNYKIENEKIEFSHDKKLTFDSNLPFLVESKFHIYQMNICYIETKIINNTFYPLTITDLSLMPKSKPDKIFKPVDDLKQLYINKFNNNAKDINIFSSKYLTLQQDEETNAIIKMDYEKNDFTEENNFNLKIKWLNLFDGKEKEQLYSIQNIFNTYNNYFKIIVAEKPENNKIYMNQNFKITLKLISKNPQKKIFVNMELETKTDKDILNEREFDIIDIIEKRIELSPKFLNNSFILICKADYLGNVFMPKIKFIINEDNKVKDEIYIEKLINFNCVSKEMDKEE